MASTLNNNAGTVVQVKPQSNVYTVLLIVAIVVLVVTMAVVLSNLLSPAPAGYGLKFGDLFSPFQAPRAAG